MTPLSRRTFLKSAGMGAAVAGFASANLMTLHANPLGLPIGSQTWPHRALIKAGRFAELAQTLAGIGVQSLEMCSAIDYEDFAPLKDGKQVNKILADHGLTCISGHFGMNELRTKHSESIAWAHDVGITQMITASLSGPEHPTLPSEHFSIRVTQGVNLTRGHTEGRPRLSSKSGAVCGTLSARGLPTPT